MMSLHYTCKLPPLSANTDLERMTSYVLVLNLDVLGRYSLPVNVFLAFVPSPEQADFSPTMTMSVQVTCGLSPSYLTFDHR